MRTRLAGSRAVGWVGVRTRLAGSRAVGWVGGAGG